MFTSRPQRTQDALEQAEWIPDWCKTIVVRPRRDDRHLRAGRWAAKRIGRHLTSQIQSVSYRGDGLKSNWSRPSAATHTLLALQAPIRPTSCKPLANRLRRDHRLVTDVDSKEPVCALYLSRVDAPGVVNVRIRSSLKEQQSEGYFFLSPIAQGNNRDRGNSNYSVPADILYVSVCL